MKHIVNFSGGKDSTAMLIRMVEEKMPIDDIVFIKVMATDKIGADFPEMYDYIEKVESYIDRKITIVPSILNFDDVFHRKYQTGKRAGTIYGFPLTIGSWCNDRLKMKTIRNHYKRYGKHMNYIGIAADEQKRLLRLKPDCCAPLAKWGMTENDCINFLKERDLLNPLYDKFCRLGCWFCVKQNLNSLRVLRRDYPKYWQMLLQWDAESPRSFRPTSTVSDLEKRFYAEEKTLIIRKGN